ncbi:MAG: PP2C family serine/threonine-protein phosphatase [Clostridiaceae bacterium]
MENFQLDYRYLLMIILSLTLLGLLLLKKSLLNKVSKDKLQIVSGTTIGTEETQQDYFGFVSNTIGTIAALGDGFGKNQGGIISSTVAVKVLLKSFLGEFNGEKPEYFIKKAFNTANTEVKKRLDDNRSGTSLISAVLINNSLNYGLTGNTMIALYRKGELHKLSEGHTMDIIAKKQFYKGSISKEVAISAVKEKKLLHYVGQEAFKEVEMPEAPIALKPGDIIILMTKGIYEYITWRQLEEKISKNKDFTILPKEIIRSIENSKNQKRDNGSIILMKYM